METIVFFLLKSVLVSFILLINYWLFLRNKKFHAYNRVYLLCVLAASIVFPLFHFYWPVIQLSEGSAAHYYAHMIEQPSSWLSSAVAFLFLISALLLLRLFFRFCRLLQIKQKCPKEKMNGFTLIQTDLHQAPFSFLDNVYWRKDIPLDDREGKKILQHELSHVKGKHSYDKLFSQILCCACWMNPFYYIIHRELNMVHEFIADEQSAGQGDTTSLASMLLYCLNKGKYRGPAHAFFQSPVKRRLTVLGSGNQTDSISKKLFVLPFTALVMLLCSFTWNDDYMITKIQHKQKLADEKAALHTGLHGLKK